MTTMRNARAIGLFLALLLFAVASPQRLSATEKGEWSAGVGVGLHLLTGDLRPIFGDEVGLGLHLRRGIGDHLSIEGSLSYTLHGGASVFVQSTLDRASGGIAARVATELSRNTLLYALVGAGVTWQRATVYELEVTRNLEGVPATVAVRREDLDFSDLLPLLQTGLGVEFFAWDPLSLGFVARYDVVLNSRSDTIEAMLAELAQATGKDPESSEGYGFLSLSLRF
ncbi:MAG: hypothetical protein D6795_10680, partial [Deltaproteobacteria bacterium]